jgi:hypothetical protein
MTFESSFDRASMFSPSDWGRKAVYKNKGKRFTINGIFDSNYQLVDVAEVGFSSSTPIFTIPTAALPCKPVVGDLLFIDCDQYTIRNFKADGTGVTVLVLEFATRLEIAEENNLLLQDGTNMLQESGSFILLETGNP